MLKRHWIILGVRWKEEKSQLSNWVVIATFLHNIYNGIEKHFETSFKKQRHGDSKIRYMAYGFTKPFCISWNYTSKIV